ncbi:MAG TPA: hypothetical protein VKX96_05175 [Chloroflexota bacterium]|nr:hypothetical protein [Chloroflexota bacterium]
MATQNVTRPAGGRSAVTPDLAAIRLGNLADGQLLIVLFLVVYEVTAYLLTIRFGFYFGDAVSRTAQATMVVASRDPHLGAIGLVWTPLPSLLQLPLIWVFARLALPLQFAGPAVTAIFGALNVSLVYQIGQEMGASADLRVFGSLIYAIQPMVWLYASNGMSEVFFATCIALLILYLVRWLHQPTVANLAGASLALSGAWWTRYEAIPIAAGFAVAIALVVLERSGGVDRLEGMLLNGLAPFAYSVFLWLFFNWLLVGNPLYFWNGPYSNVTQTSMLRSSTGPMAGVYHSFAGALAFDGVRTTAMFLGVWPILFGCTWLILRRRDLALLCLLVTMVSLQAFYLYQLYAGELFPWYRYWIMIPFYAIILAFYLRGHPRCPCLLRRDWVIRGLFAVSWLVSVASMFAPSIAVNEYPYLLQLTGRAMAAQIGVSLADDRIVADYVSSLPAGLILMDSSAGERIFLLAKNHTRFVLTTDRDYEQILNDPTRYVRYVLVARPGTVEYDTVLNRYPTLYDQGMSWARLLKTFPGPAGWKLYEVTG